MVWLGFDLAFTLKGGTKQILWLSRSLPFLFLPLKTLGTLSAATSTRTSTSTPESACGPWASRSRSSQWCLPSAAASAGARRRDLFFLFRAFPSLVSIISLSHTFFLLLSNHKHFSTVDGDGRRFPRGRPEDCPSAPGLHGRNRAAFLAGAQARRRVRLRRLRHARREWEAGRQQGDEGERGPPPRSQPPPSCWSRARPASRSGGHGGALRREIEAERKRKREREEKSVGASDFVVSTHNKILKQFNICFPSFPFRSSSETTKREM